MSYDIEDWVPEPKGIDPIEIEPLVIGPSDVELVRIAHVNHGKTTLTAAIVQMMKDNPEMVISNGTADYISEEGIGDIKTATWSERKPMEIPIINPYPEDMWKAGWYKQPSQRKPHNNKKWQPGNKKAKRRISKQSRRNNR